MIVTEVNDFTNVVQNAARRRVTVKVFSYGALCLGKAMLLTGQFGVQFLLPYFTNADDCCCGTCKHCGTVVPIIVFAVACCRSSTPTVQQLIIICLRPRLLMVQQILDTAITLPTTLRGIL